MNISYNDGGQMFGNAESKGIRNTKKVIHIQVYYDWCIS